MSGGQAFCLNLCSSDQECSGLVTVLFLRVVTWSLQSDKQ